MFGKKNVEINSWEDVNKALREYGALELKEQRINGEMTEKINDIKAKYEPRLREIQKQKSKIFADVEEFVYKHRSDIKRKTMELTYGKVQIRRIPEKVDFLKKKELVAELLEQNGYKDVVMTKKEIVMKKLKELAKKLSQNELVKLGLRLIPAGEKVNLVPNFEKIKEIPLEEE